MSKQFHSLYLGHINKSTSIESINHNHKIHSLKTIISNVIHYIITTHNYHNNDIKNPINNFQLLLQKKSLVHNFI